MNMTSVVKRLKLKLGLAMIATPFEDLDGILVDILQEITIPVFSLYNPVRERLTISTKDLELREKKEQYETYLLPDFKTRNLLYVFDVTYDDSCLSGLGYYGGGMPLMSGNIIQQAMLSNASAGLLTTMLPKMTFKYVAPRELTIYNIYASSKIVISMGFEHDKSMASIPETCRESFMDLALLDVKENLYPTLKQYTEINTAIGNINLKIDDWANAESERRDLLSRWDDTYHLDFQPVYYV